MSDYASDTQARKWTLVINNPENHQALVERIKLFCPDYACLSDEIGQSGTYHTHIYIYSTSPIRFSTLKRRFPSAHIEKARGSSKENRDYISKSGKWADTDKAETSVAGTFEEIGQLPSEAEERSPKMAQLIQDIDAGYSNIEIIRRHPHFAFHIRDIDVVRATLLSAKYRVENRPVKVHYLFGDTGTGKTRSIFEAFGATNICRITNYGDRGKIRFDDYQGEDVLVLEEFHSQPPISDMLNLLDIYPLMLNARYSDKVACYTTVCITSNLSLDQQYVDVQRNHPEIWKAFLRRIDTITEFRNGMPPRMIKGDTELFLSSYVPPSPDPYL